MRYFVFILIVLCCMIQIFQIHPSELIDSHILRMHVQECCLPGAYCIQVAASSILPG